MQSELDRWSEYKTMVPFIPQQLHVSFCSLVQGHLWHHTIHTRPEEKEKKSRYLYKAK